MNTYFGKVKNNLTDLKVTLRGEYWMFGFPHTQRLTILTKYTV